MGQLSEPHEDDDEDIGVTISGLPGEPLEDGGEGRDGDDGDDRGSTGIEGDVIEDVPVEDVEIDLVDWSEIERDAVTEALVDRGVLHHWDGTTLVVTRADEARAEEVLDEVAGNSDPLDPDADQVAYDLSEWEDDQLIALGDALDDAGVDFAWEADELFVYAADEQMVDGIIDKVSHPHELPAEDDDGDAGGELLGELFVAADRLRSDPENHEASVILIDLAHVVAKTGPPYGLARREWENLQEKVAELAELLRETTVDIDAVLAAARELRGGVRPYV